nr:MAG TPA: hypothetical protein [Caudoviricetes sp.]
MILCEYCLNIPETVQGVYFKYTPSIAGYTRIYNGKYRA